MPPKKEPTPAATPRDGEPEPEPEPIDHTPIVEKLNDESPDAWAQGVSMVLALPEDLADLERQKQAVVDFGLVEFLLHILHYTVPEDVEEKDKEKKEQQATELHALVIKCLVKLSCWTGLVQQVICEKPFIEAAFVRLIVPPPPEEPEEVDPKTKGGKGAPAPTGPDPELLSNCLRIINHCGFARSATLEVLEHDSMEPLVALMGHEDVALALLASRTAATLSRSPALRKALCDAGALPAALALAGREDEATLAARKEVAMKVLSKLAQSRSYIQAEMVEAGLLATLLENLSTEDALVQEAASGLLADLLSSSHSACKSFCELKRGGALVLKKLLPLPPEREVIVEVDPEEERKARLSLAQDMFKEKEEEEEVKEEPEEEAEPEPEPDDFPLPTEPGLTPAVLAAVLRATQALCYDEDFRRDLVFDKRQPFLDVLRGLLQAPPPPPPPPPSEPEEVEEEPEPEPEVPAKGGKGGKAPPPAKGGKDEKEEPKDGEGEDEEPTGPTVYGARVQEAALHLLRAVASDPAVSAPLVANEGGDLNNLLDLLVRTDDQIVKMLTCHFLGELVNDGLDLHELTSLGLREGAVRLASEAASFSSRDAVAQVLFGADLFDFVPPFRPPPRPPTPPPPPPPLPTSKWLWDALGRPEIPEVPQPPGDEGAGEGAGAGAGGEGEAAPRAVPEVAAAA